ncbi:MAG: sodium:proton antiporter NhaD [Rikenellaceae bacterium]
MLLLILAIFVIGYAFIAFEHQISINKAGVALLTGVILWVIYAVGVPEFAATYSSESFAHYIKYRPSLSNSPLAEQCVDFIVGYQIIESLGEISSTLFFLIGAMTIVEIIDVHGGFAVITHRITTRKKVKLLWIISLTTFFLSAMLDNMTTAIVMVMLIRRIVGDKHERWIFASMVILAANSGGAWSPIGDITTIMLWVKGNITASHIVSSTILPSLVSCVVPTYICSRMLSGRLDETLSDKEEAPDSYNIMKIMPKKERLSIAVLGLVCLISIPIFKGLTHLPPFMGMMFALGIMWVYTEIAYDKLHDISEKNKNRVPRILRRLDTPTILFFLGILLAVDALKATGILNAAAHFLDTEVHNIYVSNIIIGLLSSIVDNVPLVAASMGMYPTVDPATLATAGESAAYLSSFVVDGEFWSLLAYCAGVGGSVLIIGSVSGVVIMGIEKIEFGWYFKNISFMALVGYLSGALTFILMHAL